MLLCDVGGTHARFAKYESKGEYSNFKKYRLNDFESFEGIVGTYYKDTNSKFETARFACARTPVDGRIQYKRHAGDPDFEINFNDTQSHFGWSDLSVLNDLSAGAYGLTLLGNDDTHVVLSNTEKPWNDSRLLISVGTGVGHSGIHNGNILDAPGGHWFPITVTEEHRKVEKFIRSKKDENFTLIMEDFVSGHGLRSVAECTSAFPNDDMTPDEFLRELKNNPDAIRLFFEFLGIYANTFTAMTGFYGGIYLTGGVIDNLIKHDLVNWEAFESYFRPAMVHGVTHRLESASVNYVLHDELPLLGLTNF